MAKYPDLEIHIQYTGLEFMCSAKMQCIFSIAAKFFSFFSALTIYIELVWQPAIGLEP